MIDLYTATHGDVPELDLHGVSAAQVSYLLSDFLNSQAFHGQRDVRVIYGKGEGILRQTVLRLLKEEPLVEDFLPSAHGGAVAVVLKTQ